PIAKIAAKLAVGFTLDEIRNDITRETPASFEPTIDYVVTKFPRFAFEKFPQADQTLTTQMKSVGEAMAIGRTFKESLQKALRSREIGSYGLEGREEDLESIKTMVRTPTWDRVWLLAEGFRKGMTIDEAYQATKIDPWFLNNLKEIVDFEPSIEDSSIHGLTPTLMKRAKELGFSDRRIATLALMKEDEVRAARKDMGIRSVFKTVDTCGAEFVAYTPYLYSTYEQECEANPSKKKKIIILGGGPNRIGQGIEFDYCCVHGAFALKEDGFETIMVNCNPETVSTDYDTSDKLYFEPLTLEDVLSIIEVENPDGVIVQFGGQTPLKLAVPLEKAGVKIIGTSPDSIDRAEDRERFKELLDKLGLKQPENGTARSAPEAEIVAERIGFPVVVRPSYVLGGRAMEICYDKESLARYMVHAVKVSPEHPILIDKYLENAVEVDVDAISDGKLVVVSGIMEHIEEAGVHSGDSACSIPPYSLDKDVVAEISAQTKAMALELRVIGLMNVQFAVKDGDIYVLEVNPRASRTVPFVSKAIGVPLAKMAARVMAGKTLEQLGYTKEVTINYTAVKEAVFPFSKFPGVDTILGPEMKSTGEVMGIDDSFGKAFAKAQAGAGQKLPESGKVFVSVKDQDKTDQLVWVTKELLDMGFAVEATVGTASFLAGNGITVEKVKKVKEGRPHIVDHLKNGDIAMVINTVFGTESQRDSLSIRRTTLTQSVPYFTTLNGARAAALAIRALKDSDIGVKTIQEYHNI
ncbi:MAG TPA: carbamoyl-phosphate synthase large subunit, partial [Nitrospirota bacterium]